MSNEWFETVLEAQRRAKKRLPKSVYARAGGRLREGDHGRGQHRRLRRARVRAPRRRGRRPAATCPPRSWVRTSPSRSSSRPTGVQAVHPDGEVAVARAAAARGTAMGLSSFASKPIEDVVAANPQTFFQVYWVGTRDEVLQRIERARAAGAVGLIATLDWSFSHGRDWGSPVIPETLDCKAMARFAPEGTAPPAVAVRLRQVRAVARSHRAEHGARRVRRVPPSSVPTEPGCRHRRRVGRTWPGCASSGTGRSCSRASPGSTTPSGRWTPASPPSRCPTTAGNNLDGTPATIRALQPIAEAVGDQVEVLLDGGIRRGSDVVKALALGARAVMIGRAYLWGLAANGQAGVENVLDLLRSGIESALLGLGHASIHDLTPDDLIIPPGFTRRLGAPTEAYAEPDLAVWRACRESGVELDDAPDDRAGGLVVVALLDLVEGVLLRDDLVDLQLAGLEEVQQVRAPGPVGWPSRTPCPAAPG